MQNFDIRREPKKHPVLRSHLDKTVLHIEAKPFTRKEDVKGSFVNAQISAPTIRKKIRKSHVFALAILFFLLTFSFFSFKLVGFARSISSNNQSFYKTVTDTLGAIVPGAEDLDNSGIAQAQRNQDRVNILMLGYGGAQHDGAYLTDSIILLSLDFKQNKTTLISVPRDLWVQIPLNNSENQSYPAKINQAFASDTMLRGSFSKLSERAISESLLKGGDTSKDVVAELLGMSVDYFIAIDFEGFREVVDILGGVEVYVDNEFTDYTYPNGNNVNGPLCAAKGDKESSCRYREVHFDAGLQYLDGKRALQYVRSRHAVGEEGSDFARSKRQQRLLAAVQDKALSLNMAPRVFSVMEALQGHLQTDLSVADIKNLSEYLADVNFEEAERIALDDSNFLIPAKSNDGQWILIPSKGLYRFEDIQQFVRAKLTPQALPRTE
jgi:polyisoprenyl-teichoic acid--peptidoglycan teichoic acid transferase